VTPPPVSLDRAIRIAAAALPRAELRPAMLAALRTDPEIREAVRAAVAAGRRG
jgi:hypothetical protein